MPSPVVFTIKGLDDIQRGFRSLRQPELTRTAKPAYAEASKKILVPAVKGEARSASRYSPGPGRKRGKRGKKGPIARNVTTKLIPRRQMPQAIRSSVLFAYGTAPRAWYRHFVVKGTRPHSLAKGARLKTGVNQNIGRQHPGAKGNDFVGRAQKRSEGPFLRHFNEALMRVYKQRSKAK